MAHLSNHLPPNAGMTTSGTDLLPFVIQQYLRTLRNALLLSLLAHSVPFHVHLTPQNTISILSKDDFSAANVLCAAHMGICEGASN